MATETLILEAGPTLTPEHPGELEAAAKLTPEHPGELEAAAKLTPEHLQEVKETFELFDQNGDGAISFSELQDVLKSFGQDSSVEELADIIASGDVDNSGAIDYKEFLELTAKKHLAMAEQEELWKAFHVFDNDGNGRVCMTELKKVLDILGEKFTHTELQELIDLVDMDGDGVVDYQEFVQLMKKF